MSHFVHPQGICESQTIGAGTRVWAFAHVLPGARLGADCNVCDHVFIENDVIVGDRVTIKCGVQLWDGLRIEDDVFIGPNVSFTNDRFPRSKKYPEKFLTTLVEKGASIGANATILPGLTIGRSAMVGAGAVVTHSVPPFAIAVGNPARIVGYVTNAQETSTPPTPASTPTVGRIPSRVKGVFLQRFAVHEDMRGSLSVGHFEKEIPFHPKRYFLVFDVPSKDVRGEHAHRHCEQFLICVHGSVRVVASDGDQREEFILDNNACGVYLPPGTWGTQYAYGADAVLLVFASHEYDASDYIRSYDEYLSWLSSRR
jgi:UDP-2-acetamido-3-amino-2,3-dideoxy-glucuronate N-acetyltransferase